jgi:hypothetical protein
VAGSLSEAERIDALAEPEAKWDHDTYGMKRAGMRPREQDSDLGRGLVLRWLMDWDAGRRLGPTPADTPPQILACRKRLVVGQVNLI